MTQQSNEIDTKRYNKEVWEFKTDLYRLWKSYIYDSSNRACGDFKYYQNKCIDKTDIEIYNTKIELQIDLRDALIKTIKEVEG